MYVQFVKKQSMHGVVTMKTLQTLQISFAIIVFQISIDFCSMSSRVRNPYKKPNKKTYPVSKLRFALAIAYL